jgi:ubiquinone/menaquinone biosynthesis C-methylase UbiE
MKPDDIFSHWQGWAVKYGTDLRATTLASSIKRLEVAALQRAIERVLLPSSTAALLEIGCGNGQNIVALAKIFADRSFEWVGVDYVPQMIESAQKNAEDAGISRRARFITGDVLRLDAIRDLDAKYSIVFADRLIINLDTIDKQLRAIDLLANRVSEGGALIMIENSRQTKDHQNDLREVMGLARRADASFNLFLDDEAVIPHLNSRFTSVEIEDFGSLHDVLLYVLLPHALKSEFHYDHPLMQSVADLCSRVPFKCGEFGQNRLYLCRH